MIDHPAALVAALIAIQLGVARAARLRAARPLFSVLPPMFWIYFLPVLASMVGLIPRKNPLYGQIIELCLPACLILLFLSVELKTILRLGRPAMLMMLASSASILFGGPLVQVLFGGWLPAGAWSGLGALSASWMGGSANMVAVKASVGTPEDIFTLVIIVDVFVAYTWMGLVVGLSGLQGRFDRWNRSDTAVMEELGQRLGPVGATRRAKISITHLPVMLVLAGAGAAASILLARVLPEVPGAITTYTWTIIGVSAVGVALSFTPARHLEERGASRVGNLLLYLVLTCIGAGADLQVISRAAVWIAAGVCWIAFHALVMLVVARLSRAPMFLVATASQANLGGPVSAPIVAAAYQPALSQVGLLLAVLGNVAGTYLGILCTVLCRYVAA